jgi:hypothetical protein
MSVALARQGLTVAVKWGNSFSRRTLAFTRLAQLPERLGRADCESSHGSMRRLERDRDPTLVAALAKVGKWRILLI